ncbi:MAG: hypothetical protein KDD50_16375, partial [Bdellovibrionales bacterium]|nr:hypothetical protein [Bdellovibrionales bacterium]
KSKENDLPSAQLENEKGRENHLAGQEEQNLNENELKELLDDIENNREQGNRNQEKVAKKNQMDGMKNSLSNAPKFPWEKRNVQRTSSEKKPTTLEKNKNVTNINQLKDVDIPPGLKPLQRALNQSLNKSVAKNQSITSQLNDKYYVECVGVRSEVANGYLLVISPEEGPLLNDFLLDFRSSLIQEIGFQNTRMNIDTSERLTLPPVEDILSFVDKEATISFFRDHKHIEVCVAFFETDMIYEEKNITEKGMTPVKVQNVAVEKPVDFNTFLHFKKNDKFYLYIKKSRHLMKKQKEKLVDKKVEYLHVNSKDLNLLKKFIAEGFFEEKIASYKEDKLKKAS